MFLILTLIWSVHADTSQDVQYLNELPLDKLLKIKTSIEDLVTPEYDNDTTTTAATYLQQFGAQAQALKSPIKRGDFDDGWDGWKKHGHSSKISNFFSMSVTTLAFLAFGGYLLCLIVQAMRAKQMYYQNMNPMFPTTVPTTFFVSAGIKKRPTAQFASYGRKRRDNRELWGLKEMDIPPEQMFSALLNLCEGYAKWSER